MVTFTGTFYVTRTFNKQSLSSYQFQVHAPHPEYISHASQHSWDECVGPYS